MARRRLKTSKGLTAQPIAPRPDENPGVAGQVRRWRASRWGKVITTSLALLAVALSGYYMAATLGAGLRQLLADPPPVHWGAAAAGLALTMLCVLLGGVIWRLVLRGLGQSLPWRTCLRSHLLANLGGYLPGYGWKFVGKAYLVQRAGAPVALVSLAVLIEFVGLAASRAAVAVAALPPGFLPRFGWHVAPATLWAFRLAAWGLLAASPWLLQALVRRARPGRRFAGLTVRPAALLGALALMCITWLIYGLGFALLVRAIYALRPEHLVPLVFSSTVSFLVSLLMFIVPAGLGVRESVVVFTLTGVLPAGIIALGALISRLALVIAELLGALVGSWLGVRERLCK